MKMKAPTSSGNTPLGAIWKETRRNWKTIMVLMVLFFIGLTLRSYFYYQESVESEVELSGNDPYYHKRVIDHVQDEKEHLVRDPLLGYPAKPHNPRPPLFDWSIAVEGLVLGTIFGSVGAVTLFVTQMTPSFWGALTIVPVYFLTKEYFGKKAGLWAALFLTIMPSHIDRSSFGFADHDSFVLFFVVVSFYFLAKSLRQLKTERWIDNFLSPRSIVKGFRRFANENFLALGYAMMAAISLATVALAWKGFSYVIAIIMVYYLVQLIINAFKHEDSTGIAAIIMIMLTVPLLLALPVYGSMDMIWSQWGLQPVIYIYVGAWALTLAFVPTRDVPWIILLPVLAGLTGLTYFVLHQTNPDLVEALFSGGGYFVKTKRYSTIAEAQAPILSRLIVSYGPVTFFFALVGILFAFVRFTRHWRTDELFIVLWAFVSIFMAISAVRFMFNAAPAFAILQGWIVFLLLKKTDFRSITRSLQGFSGQFWYGLRKGLKVRHVIVTLFMVFMVILPNFWFAFDASLPYEKKREIDNQIYDSMPEWLRPEKYNEQSTLWWTGAFGQGFPSEYWHTFFEWLAEQDNEYDPEQRPAFMSWWDYGMWCVEIGEHPTVADNFMNGHEMAGNFIASPNETNSLALLVTRTLEYEFRHSTGENAATRLAKEYLGEEDGALFIDAIRNPKKYIDTINDHPEMFGNKDGLRVGNARFSYASYVVEKLDEDVIIDFLIDAERLTGNWIRYFAVDSRMFPFSYYNTGIFYAPITLSDHAVSDYLETMVQVGNRLYTPDEFERLLELDPDLEADDLVLTYTPLFFDTMFYRAYIGYSALDIGGNLSMGIPGISGELAAQPPMQGWMLKHYKLVYKSTYYNPYNSSLSTKHRDDWEIITFEEAAEHQQDENDTGTVDTQTGLVQGVMVLKYYHGAQLSGRVMTEGGVGIPGAVVTIYDEFGIPHDRVETDDEGAYEVISPSGEVVLRASKGGEFNPFFQTFETVLVEEKFNITESQAERWTEDLDGDGRYDYLVDMDLIINSTYINGTLFWDTDQDGKLGDDEEPVANAEIELEGANIITLTTDDDGNFTTPDAVESSYDVILVQDGNRYDLSQSVKTDGLEPTETEVPVQGFSVYGKVTLNDTAVKGVEVTLLDTETDRTYATTTNGKGQYTFEDLLPGTSGSADFELTFDHTGSITITRTFNGKIGRDKEVDIVLMGASLLTGTATIDLDGDGVSDGPAPNAMVIAIGAGTTTEAMADANGSYSMVVPEGSYVVTARAAAPDGQLGAKVSADAPGSANIRLEPLYGLGGTVYIDDDEDGEYDQGIDTPIGNAEITITGSSQWHGRSNSAGGFNALLPYGDYYITAAHEASGTNVTWLNTSWVSLDEPATADLELTMGELVSGYLYWDRNDNDEPDADEYINGVSLAFTGEHEFTTMTGGAQFQSTQIFGNGFFFNTFSVSTGSNGSFEALLIPGNYTVSSPNFEDVELPEGDDILLEMTPLESTLIGTAWADVDFDAVIDPAERAASGLEVTITSVQAGDDPIEVVTDADGSFTLTLLPGTYEIAYNGTDDNDGLFQGGMIATVPYGEAEVEQAVLGYQLLHMVPEYYIGGAPVEPDFGPGDTVRIVSAGIPWNMSVPTENGTTDWTEGGYLFPGEYDVFINYDGYAYLGSINITASGTYPFELEMGVQYDGGIRTLDMDQIVDRDLGAVMISFISADGVFVSESLMADPFNNSYNFSVLLPPGDLTASINHTNGNDLYLLDAPLDNGTLTVVRHFRVTGKVYYDEDRDGNRDTKEGLEGIRLSFIGDGTYNVTTEGRGEYVAHLPYGSDGSYNITTPSTDFVGLTPSGITLPAGTTHIEVLPRNLTINGTAFTDMDLDGKIDHGEEIDADRIVFTPDVGPAVTADLDGANYTVELSPATYTIHAFSDEYAIMTVKEVVIGNDTVFDLNMTKAVSVTGTLYYTNMTGDVMLPSSGGLKKEMTLTAGGSTITVPVNMGQYQILLPIGEYRVKATAELDEYGLTSEYSINKKFDFDSEVRNIEMKRDDDYSVKARWRGEAVRTLPGTTVEYTIEVQNVGNMLMNGVELSVSRSPASWNVTFDDESTRRLDLALNETVEVNVTMVLAKLSQAGIQEVRIDATPLEKKSDDDSVTLEVNVSATYGFTLDTIDPDRGISKNASALIDFVIINDANTKDTYIIEGPADPDGFTIELLNATMEPLTDTDDDGMLDTGPIKSFEFQPVFLNITSEPDTGGKVSLPVKVTSVTTGMVQTAYLSIQVTDPDLTVYELNVTEIALGDDTFVDITVNVTNAGLIAVDDIDIEYYMDGEPLGSRDEIIMNGQPLGNATIPIPLGVDLQLTLSIMVNVSGKHTFSVVVAPANHTDLHDTDNRVSTELKIGDDAPTDDGGDDGALVQFLAVSIVILVLLVVYGVYRRKRRW